MKKFHIKKIFFVRLKFFHAIIFIAVMSFLLTFFLFLLQPLPISYVFEAIAKSFGLNFFLNWLPVILAMLFFYFAGAGAAGAVAIVGAAVIFLGFANRTKIILRYDPLMPWDIFLGGEVLGIARSFGTGVIFFAAGIIFYVVAAILFAFIIRSEKLNTKIRAIGCASCIALAFVLNAPLYNNSAIIERLFVEGNVLNHVNQFNSRGFLFSFIHAFNTNRIKRPENFNADAVLEKISRAETNGLRLRDEKNPHIIMIMSEAFSGISEHFCFENFDDPLENFRALADESIQGELFVSVLGGGTSQTEFDVLTGLNSRQFAGVPFAFRMITSEFESVASVLNSVGYRSEFLHPGFGWFYNRQNVYKFLGFERLVFIDEFAEIPTKGMYVNERGTIDRLIEMFSTHRESFPEVPYFNFTVTIQNHGPYVDKYLYDGNVTAANFYTNWEFSDADTNALSNYFHGLRDADIELRRLVEFLREVDEPVALVYFGDHNPALNHRVYETIFPAGESLFEEMTRFFRVPFMIWTNFCDEKNILERAVRAPNFERAGRAPNFEDVSQQSAQRHEDDNEKNILAEKFETNNSDAEKNFSDEEIFFNASFLGAYVLEILGLTNISPFFDFNAQLRREFPVITETRSFTPCGTPSSDVTDEQRAPLYLYRDWSYFRIFYEK